MGFSSICKEGPKTKLEFQEKMRQGFFLKKDIIPGQEKLHEKICEIVKKEKSYYYACDKNQKNMPNPFYFDLKIMKNFL